MTLTDEQLEERIAARSSQPPVPAARYRHIQPFSTAADGLIDTITNTDGRWMFGLTELDACIRGVGPSELMYITGRAHSGKTQLVLQSIANNPQAKVIIFTPDEVAELILTKMIGITRDVNAEELEYQIKHGSAKHIDMVRRVAAEEFANLVVIDKTLGFSDMSVALQEAEDMWGDRCDSVMIDFLELLPGEAEHSGVTWKSQNLKAWTKAHEAPVICLHQASRSSGPKGQSAGMSAMRYGGETEAIFVLEVFRKRDNPELDSYEKERHRNTISVAVVKNKRPPSRLGEWDFYIDPDYGMVRHLKDGDMSVTSIPTRPVNAMDAMAQLRGAS